MGPLNFRAPGAQYVHNKPLFNKWMNMEETPSQEFGDRELGSRFRSTGGMERL